MVQNIKKGIFWGITITLGLIISDVLRNREINILHAVLGGIVMGLIEFGLAVLSDRRKK